MRSFRNGIPSIVVLAMLVVVQINVTVAAPWASSASSPSGITPRKMITTKDFYRVIARVSTTSDWTYLQVTDGATVADLKWQVLGDAETSKFSANAGNKILASIAKKAAGDTTNATMETNFAITTLQADKPISFLIRKGAIGVTAVTLYNFNVERNIIGVFNAQSDTSFVASIDSVTMGGPLRSTVQGSSRLVWAFYYVWYNSQSWSDSRVIDKPLLGTYDSGDRNTILSHIRMAKSSGIDGFIVSWAGGVTDTRLRTVLDAAAQENFKVTILFESQSNLAGGTREGVLQMFRQFFSNFGDDQRYFRIDGRPVIFVYGVDSQPEATWTDILGTLKSEGHEAFYIAESDNANTDYLEAFDGIHIYEPNTPSAVQALNVTYKRLQLSTRSFGFLYSGMTSRLWAATVTPGFDDALLQRTTNHYLPRDDGNTYRKTFDAALASNPDWILITSFNEYYENSYIEPSTSYGWKYIDLTTQFSSKFKQVAFVPAITIWKGLGSSTVSANKPEKVEITLVNTGNGSAIELQFRETGLPNTLEFLNGTLEGKVDRLLPEESVASAFWVKIITVINATLPRTQVSYRDADNQTYLVTSDIVTVLATIDTVTQAIPPASPLIPGFPLESILVGLGFGLLGLHLICRKRLVNRKRPA